MNKTIQILTSALKNDPENWETRRHLAELLMAEDATAEARVVVAEAPFVPENEEDELFLAEQLIDVDPGGVLPFIDRVLARNPRSASAYALKGRILALLEGEPEAPTPEAEEFTPDPEPKAAPEPEPEAPAAAAPLKAAPRKEVAAASSRLIVGKVDSKAPVRKASPRKASPKLAVGAPAVREPAPVPAAPSTLTASQLAQRVADNQLKAKKKNRTVAVFVAGVLHAVVILLCIIWILKPGPLPGPMVIMAVPPAAELQQQVVKKAISQILPQRLSSSSASRAQVIAANTISPVSVPQVEVEELTDDIIGAGDSFGMGSGWGDGLGSGGGGGTVRFFGDEKKARRVCYIVDFSLSMSSSNGGDTRQDMLKRELVESIDKLDPAMRYCVIFFSGVGWLQHETPRDREVVGRVGMRDVNFDVTWYDASKKNKKETIGRIQAMPLASASGAQGGGTLWMTGFRPAMNIKPKADIVYLLTDGVCHDYLQTNATTEQEMIQEFAANVEAWNAFRDSMLALVPEGVSINTVSMERPGTIAKRLAELAEMTAGDFSIVWNGKTYTGKRARKFGDKKYDEL
jgi:hypothetical protein